jgi:hypothetical protein
LKHPNDGKERNYLENPDDGAERNRPLQKKKCPKGRGGTPAPKEKQKKTKSEQKNQVPHIMKEKNQGTHIWKCIEENAKQYIRMRKQHVLPMNPCVRIIFK